MGLKMPNRFYTENKENWFGPTHLGQGMKPEKRVTKFVFDGPPESQIPKLRASYEAAINAVSGLRTKRDSAEATGQFTPLGVTEKLAQEAVTNELPAIKRARVVTEKIKAEIAEKRAGLTLAKPTDEQHREHAEIRAAMRAMRSAERHEFLRTNRADPTVAAAIAGAIPALSGVDPAVRQNIAREALQREHGAVLDELADLEEVAEIVEKVTKLAREEVREILGINKEVFESIARAGEHGGGELPLRMESRVIDGKRIEVCRVYDIAAKEWRDATPEEIGRAA
jgi:hypothetical protein